MDKKIKMIVFDQDGTLYPSEDDLIFETRKKTKYWLSNKLRKDLNEIEELYNQLPKRYENPYLGFASLGCSVDEYMSEVFDKIDPSRFLKFNPTLYNFFKYNKQLKALVTFASPNYTIKLQETLKLKDFYDRILYVKDFETFSKGQCYKKLAKEFNIKFDEMCVIGDSYYNDILPAQQLGCETILISNKPKVFKNVKIYKNIESYINKGESLWQNYLY